MAKQIIAYCGLDCVKCPAYEATKKNNDELRKKTAETWSKQFNAKMTAKDINCDGCLSNKKLFSHCYVCEIRNCGISKKVKNCAACDDYACTKLDQIFKFVPEAKTTLDSMVPKK